MQRNVIVEQLVQRKLRDLFVILLEKDYFLEEENARAYISKLRQFIDSIPQQQHRLTKNKRWGRYYATYKANHHTTWYITFDYEGNWYLVVNIFNNHMKAYPYFIA